jgi:hypothetical protein
MRTYTTANNETKAAMHAAYMNPYITSLTIKEVPFKRCYAKELKIGYKVPVFIHTGGTSSEGYFCWKEIASMESNNRFFTVKFTDGTCEVSPKKTASKFEVMK